MVRRLWCMYRKGLQNLPSNQTNFLTKVHLFQKKKSNEANCIRFWYLHEQTICIWCLRKPYSSTLPSHQKQRRHPAILKLFLLPPKQSTDWRSLRNSKADFHLITPPLSPAGWLSLEKFLCGLTKLRHLPGIIIKWKLKKKKKNDLSWNIKAHFLNYSS